MGGALPQPAASAPAAAAPTAAPPAAAPPSSEAQQLADMKAMFEQGLIPSREIYEADPGPPVNESPARFHGDNNQWW